MAAIGELTVPIFARIHDQDFQLGELTIDLQTRLQEDGTVLINGDKIRRDVAKAFDSLTPTRSVRDETNENLQQEYLRLQRVREELIARGVNEAELVELIPMEGD